MRPGRLLSKAGSAARIDEQVQRDIGKRHDAPRIEAHRRQLLPAARIGAVAVPEMPSLRGQRGPRATPQGAAEQSLCTHMGARSRAGRRNLVGRFAQGHREQKSGKIDAGKERVHRLDEPWIAVDIQRQVS